jgi:excinuclease ABC subunit C
VENQLEARARACPDSPGVYLFKDAAGQVLYVGKARSLKHRVRSYLGPRPTSTRLALMVEAARDLEYIVTADEVAALILENNLIKRHRPPYNIRLRDDKQYPYLRVTLEEDFPRLLIARRPARDGSRYFGPYTRAGAVHETVRLARRLFPQRTCSNRTLAQATRPCLNYHIGRCPGPCGGRVTREAYRAATDDLTLFLDGRHDDLVRQLEQKMQSAADKLEFERAAALRDQLRAVSEVTRQHQVVAPGGGDCDVLAFARSEADAVAQVFWIRDGKLVGRESFHLTGIAGREDPEIMTALVEQYYQRATAVPDEVIVVTALEDEDTVRAWLQRLRGRPVRVIRPRRGTRLRLLQMALENARLALAEIKPLDEQERERAAAALTDLAAALGLPAPPHRMECFDVSNLHGQQAVAAMAVFEDGLPRPDHYRKFRIKTVGQSDDYAMMAEAIERRFRRGLRDRENRVGSSFAGFPDLLVVDGGRGQLNTARSVLTRLGVEVPAVGLAKQDEEIYLPDRPEPLCLPDDSRALLLLRHLRDETHRFALGYHRQLRRNAGVGSRLERIPGVGPRRRAALLRQFGSLRGVREASVDEVARVPGIGPRLAALIKAELE